MDAVTKSQQQLTWMRENLPPISAPSLPVATRRKAALIRYLKKLSVTESGCMVYGNSTAPYARVFWPEHQTRDISMVSRSPTARCSWPGCRRQNTPRQKYCRQDGHTWRNAGELHRSENGLRQCSLPHLLVELYTGTRIKKMLATTCGNSWCCHPGHRYKMATKGKYTTAQVRDIVKRRLAGATHAELQVDYPNLAKGSMWRLASGNSRGYETADLRKA